MMDFTEIDALCLSIQKNVWKVSGKRYLCPLILFHAVRITF